MITIHLSGGLGNQLFQYAAGLSLARFHDVSLRLDLRKFRQAVINDSDPSTRPCRILDLNINEKRICSQKEESYWQLRWNLSKNFHIPNQWLGFCVEKEHEFSPNFFNTATSVYLRGYFQSELFFKAIEPEIRSIFRPRQKDALARIHNKMLSLRPVDRELVGLHIRRGDFLALTDRDCMTSDQFIVAAMSLFPKGYFIIFSDDIAWCREYFAGNKHVSFSPFKTVLDDFFGMSMCDHNIIAKSTFSWWASYLNENPGRKVIAPFINKNQKWAGASRDYYPSFFSVIDQA